MTNRPWMPFYTADHLADTLHLSALEHGAYMFLILHYWRNGPLPANDKELRRIARLSHGRSPGILAKVLTFFVRDGDTYKHPRIDAEISRADAQIEAKTQRAQAAAARWGRSRHANALPADGSKQREPQSQPESENKKHMSDKSDLTVFSENKSERKTYPESFEAFWRDYPTDALMSKIKTYRIWLTLDAGDRTKARAALPAFKDYCGRNVTYRPVHAAKFLSERRFDGFVLSVCEQDDHADMIAHMWEGEARKLIEAIGGNLFRSYFLGASFQPGPPPCIRVRGPALANLIESKFAAKLRSLYGEDVKVVGP